MATVNATTVFTAKESILHRWTITTGGDVGNAIDVHEYPDRTVHVTGTFGSVTMRGSNKVAPDPAVAGDWFNLKDMQGNTLTFTAAGGALIAENPYWISPITTGGSAYEVAISGNRE